MKINAILLQANDSGTDERIPVFVTGIDDSKVLPITYRYKGRGYTDLFFSTIRSRIVFRT